MEIIVSLFLILFLSYFLSLLFARIGLPKLLAPVIVGIVFSLTTGTFYLLGNRFTLMDVGAITSITFIKDIAIIFLMFFVGLKIDFRHFLKSSRRSIYIALFASLFPFLLGFLGTQLAHYYGLLDYFIPDGKNLFLIAYVVGVCLSVTAEVVVIEILEELNILKSVLGETMIEAGLVDTIIGVLLLSGVIIFLPSSSYAHLSVGAKIGVRFMEMAIFAFILFLLGKYIVPKLLHAIRSQKDRETSYFTLSIIITLFLALISVQFDMGGSILGAIFAGIIVQHTLLSGDKADKQEEQHLTNIVEITTFGFFAPFFLFWIGWHAEFSILFSRPFLALFILALAIVGKYVGAYVGNYLSGGSSKEGSIIGWGMNTKGEVDIMIATLMFSLGLFSQEIFSSIIFMSLATTLISPIIFRKLVKAYHGI